MPQDRGYCRMVRRTKLVRIAFGAATAALVVCATYSAARAGDDEDNLSFTDKFLRTLGLKNPGDTDYGINYSERSPLVVPPTRNLPPPVAAGPPPTPNWPKDPDIKKRQEAKADSSDKPVIRNGDSVMEDERALRPDELNPGRAAPTAVAAPGTPEQTTPANPAKKSIFSLDVFNQKEEYATFTGEPSRESLTDPPSGYRTPSPDQPYGIVPEHQKYHIATPSEHGEPVR
jgi:hypothetical protein